MSNAERRVSKFGRLKGWFRGLFPDTKTHLVETVPNDIALCEFDCRKTECSFGEWERCARRLRFERLRQEYEEKSCC